MIKVLETVLTRSRASARRQKGGLGGGVHTMERRHWFFFICRIECGFIHLEPGQKDGVWIFTLSPQAGFAHLCGVMLFERSMPSVTCDDEVLVAASVRGDRDAFAQIVRRYQSLICSLAYNATGSLSDSEDLAQETFLVAWRELKHLREANKLRSWLCGIARNLTANAVRRQQHQPVHKAESIDLISELPSDQKSAAEGVIREEEEAILWRSLEQIPTNYREPLILFYREGESVERVAQHLELTEDAVKQRLSRGRKMLADEVTAFVEGALKRSTPGRAFTAGVLASLPVFATSATAATIGAGAAKGSVVASSATIVAIFAGLIGPLVGLLGGYIGIRAGLKSTRTPRERAFIARASKQAILGGVVFNVLLLCFISLAVRHWKHHPILFGLMGVGLPLIFLTWICKSAFESNRQFHAIRTQEKAAHPEMYEPELLDGKAGREYRSKLALFGVPLIHVCAGVRIGSKSKPAVGWIAIGDRAFGILFAAGGIAVGGLAMGGVAVGVIALGGATLGVLAIGGMAIGGFAVGGAAIGVIAVGGLATGWVAAQGGMAIAKTYALGGGAIAQHANDAAAKEFFQLLSWMDLREAKHRNLFTLLCCSPALLFLLSFFRNRNARKSAITTEEKK